MIMQLDPIVVSDEDWVLLEAADINSRGDIVCNAHQAGSNKSIAVILNPLIVHPPGPKNKVPSQLLYFNWLAYRFWWHFPKEFSPEEKKRFWHCHERKILLSNQILIFRCQIYLY